MSRCAAMLMSLILLAHVSAYAQTLEITRGGTRAVRQGPPESFTGTARIEMLFDARDPSHASGGSVTFEAGARTAWHVHPRGQVLIVTAGSGRVQRWGSPIEEIRTGDVVRIPAGQKHWHGAAPTVAMTHLAITEHRDGTVVEWLEHVSDAQYNAPVIVERADGAAAQPEEGAAPRRPSGPLQQRVAPGLAALTDEVLFGDVWRRTALSPRDRSLVTISVLIATGKPAQLSGHLGRALDNGVLPSEASGVLAHLAIYSGWPNAVSALEAFDQVYTARKVDTMALSPGNRRASAAVSGGAPGAPGTSTLQTIAPKFAQLTNEVVFGDLWRRSDLSPRDRSLVTIAALAAMGDDAQLDEYLHQGFENGLTREHVAEALTHLAFYAGWGRATMALGVLETIAAR